MKAVAMSSVGQLDGTFTSPLTETGTHQTLRIEVDDKFLRQVGLLYSRLQTVVSDRGLGAARDAGNAAADLHAAVASLVVVLRFLHGIQLPAELSQPLEKLTSALDDLLHGGQPVMLASQAPRHRPSTLPSDRHVQSLAAVALDCLVRAQVSLQDAAAYVADQFDAKGHKQTGAKPITARTVIEWRSRSIGRGGDPARREEFDFIRIGIDQLTAGQTIDAPRAKEIVRKLAAAVEPKHT